MEICNIILVLRSMFIIKKIQIFFDYIKGSDTELTLESQVFNITTFVGSILLFIVGFVNIYIDMELAAILMPFISSLLVFVFFYLSRFKNVFLIAVLALIVIMYGSTCGIWFFNSGQEGSIIHVFNLYFLFFFAILPQNLQKYYLGFHVIALSSTYVLEYLHPEWVSPYKDGFSQLIDQVVTMSFATLCLYLVLMSIKTMYEKKRKQVEEQKSDLEKMNAMKDKILSVISHDVRSPLTQLEAVLDLVASKGLNQEKGEFLLKELHKNIQETQHLLDTLVTWASLQLQSKQIIMRNEEIELVDLLKNASEAFSSHLNSKELTIKYEMPDKMFVKSDMNTLSLVVRNLLSNAIKFSHPKGEIILGVKKEEGKGVFYIRDFGVGIEKEKLANIFSTESNKTTRGTKNEKGSGLGLLLCRDFIVHSGGKLIIESEENKGTSCFVYIPMAS